MSTSVVGDLSINCGIWREQNKTSSLVHLYCQLLSTSFFKENFLKSLVAKLTLRAKEKAKVEETLLKVTKRVGA